MPQVDPHVELDVDVLRTVDAVAHQLGASRGEVTEQSLRRGLAAQVLEGVMARAQARGGRSEEQAAEAAYAEVRAARRERRREQPEDGPAGPPAS